MVDNHDRLCAKKVQNSGTDVKGSPDASLPQIEFTGPGFGHEKNPPVPIDAKGHRGRNEEAGAQTIISQGPLRAKKVQESDLYVKLSCDARWPQTEVEHRRAHHDENLSLSIDTKGCHERNEKVGAPTIINQSSTWAKNVSKSGLHVEKGWTRVKTEKNRQRKKPRVEMAIKPSQASSGKTEVSRVAMTQQEILCNKVRAFYLRLGLTCNVTVIDNEGGGNCQMYAVVAALKEEGVEQDHRQVRQTQVQWLINHGMQFKQPQYGVGDDPLEPTGVFEPLDSAFYLPLKESNDRKDETGRKSTTWKEAPLCTMKEFTDQHAEIGVWGEQLTAIAAANAYGLSIIVVQEKGDLQVVRMDDPLQTHFLGFGDGHYRYLKVTDIKPILKGDVHAEHQASDLKGVDFIGSIASQHRNSEVIVKELVDVRENRGETVTATSPSQSKRYPDGNEEVGARVVLVLDRLEIISGIIR